MTANKPAWKRLITSGVLLFSVLFIAGIGALSWGISQIEWKETVTIRETITVTVHDFPDSVKVMKGFARDCTLLGGQVAGIAGVFFCIDAQVVPGVMWNAGDSNVKKYQASNDCLAAGGRMIDLSPAENDKGCYTYTIFKELGARYDYRPTN